jgi:outer membrane receptor protein involved in Fe transport
MGGLGGKKGLLFKYSLLWCLLLGLIGAIPFQVSAQEKKDKKSGEEFTLEEIVVTGSRIAKNNNESTSPIVTVDTKFLDQNASSSLMTQLNKLPQFTPTGDVPQVESGDIQPTATHTPGQSTIALRGIGANRTLTLINGRRGTPANALGVIDINTIPTAAIAYIDTISGGASSTYGADAVAGVVNIIMKDRFEGFQLDLQSSMSQVGDDQEYNASAVWGANFPDDRGNIMMAMAYNNRRAAKQEDHSIFTGQWSDPSRGGTGFFTPYSGFSTQLNPPDVDVLNSVLTGSTFETSPVYSTIFYDPKSGKAFTGFSTSTIPGVPSAYAAGIVDEKNIKILNNGTLSQNDTNLYLIFPLERYNFYTQGDYRINKYVTVFGQAYYSRTVSRTTQEPGIIVSGWSVQIDPTTHRNSIPAPLLTLLDSRPDPNGLVSLQALLPINRSGDTDTNTYNITSGIRGEFPGIEWTYEAFVSHGEAETNANMTGFYSLERMRAVMGAPEFGVDGVWKANSGPPDFGFGAATATCTSGLNPFDWENTTPDCWNAVAAPVRSKQLMVQNIYEANTQGHIADFAMGEMRGAFGVSYREDQYDFQSANINTQGRSFNDQVLGLYPAGEANGKIVAKEEYAELLVPILKDLPGVKEMTLSLGGRRSDYNTTGVSYTYKAILDYKMTDYLRFRGGYNRAERSPNIGELYLARTSSFGAMLYGDSCSMRNTYTSWTANEESDPNHWKDVLLMCAKMNNKATPDGTANNYFFGSDLAAIQDYLTAHPNATTQNMLDDGLVNQDDYDAMTAGGFGWIWPIDIGNSDLKPETADTWTFGFVLDSFVKDIPALMDWRISMDFYTIEVKDAIGLQTGDVVLQQCFSSEFNPTCDINSPYCAGVNRDARFGTLGTVDRTYFNNGHFKTSGIDTQINWGMDAGPGHLAVSTLISYLIKIQSSELPSNPMIDYVGTFGPSGNGLNGYSYKWKTFTTFSYSMQSWDVSLRWSHYSSLKNTAGSNTPLPAYDMFDLSGDYKLKDNVTLRFGIENLLDKDPDLYNVNYNDPNGMYGGSYASGVEDQIGRRFYLGLKMYF